MNRANPHPTLSLTKGEASLITCDQLMCMPACVARVRFGVRRSSAAFRADRQRISNTDDIKSDETTAEGISASPLAARGEDCLPRRSAA
jgi:hypothetical protein